MSGDRGAKFRPGLRGLRRGFGRNLGRGLGGRWGGPGGEDPRQGGGGGGHRARLHRQHAKQRPQQILQRRRGRHHRRHLRLGQEPPELIGVGSDRDRRRVEQPTVDAGRAWQFRRLRRGAAGGPMGESASEPACVSRGGSVGGPGLDRRGLRVVGIFPAAILAVRVAKRRAMLCRYLQIRIVRGPSGPRWSRAVIAWHRPMMRPAKRSAREGEGVKLMIRIGP